MMGTLLCALFFDHMKEHRDIVIIGAGAAGLMCGIMTARECRALGVDVRITLVDGAKKIGAKILVIYRSIGCVLFCCFSTSQCIWKRSTHDDAFYYFMSMNKTPEIISIHKRFAFERSLRMP